MKNSNVGWATFVAAVAVAGLLIAGIPATLQAQSTGLRVNVPFEFHVGGKTLPAGTYSVWPVAGAGAISISDGKGHVASILTVGGRHRAGNSGESALVFNVYGGNSYFLGEVRWAGYPTARSLPKSKLELDIARTMQASPATEAIAAR